MNHPGTIFAILAVAGATSLSGCSVETMQDSPAGGQGGATSQPAEDSPYAATPYLGELESTLLFEDIWERPGLSLRDRSLVTVAVTQALYRTEELRRYLELALDNGVTRDEIAELMTHVTMYAG